MVVIEAQFGKADHEHLGKLVTYARAVEAAVAVWAVAAAEPFLREHLDALAELNEAFGDRRRFTAVTVTLESEPRPVPVAPGTPLLPRMSQTVQAGEDSLRRYAKRSPPDSEDAIPAVLGSDPGVGRRA